MKDSIIYIKVSQSTQVVNRKILIEDVAEIFGNDTAAVKRAGEQILYTAKGDKNEKIVFSIMKVIKLIEKVCPDIDVVNLGEPDFVVEYKMPIAPKKALEYIKLGILTVLVFIGAAFTIMTFNTDVSVSDVFDNLYQLVTGEEKQTGTFLEISYCVGILIGILGFYNHYKSSKVHDDPTPIHIEMRNYEEEMNKAIINDASREGKIWK